MLPTNSVGEIYTGPYRIVWTEPTGQHTRVWTAATMPIMDTQTLEVQSFPSNGLVPREYFWLNLDSVLPTVTPTTVNPEGNINTTPNFALGSGQRHIPLHIENDTLARTRDSLGVVAC